MRRPLAAVGFVLSVARAARADAGPALPFELTWEAAAACPDAAFVRQRVAQIVRGASAEHTPVVAKAIVGRTQDGRFRLDLTLRTGDLEESKTIEAASCASIAQATATIIALAIESPAPPATVEGPTASPTPATELERGPPEPSRSTAAREHDEAREHDQDGAAGPPPAQRSEGALPAVNAPPRPWFVAAGAFTAIDTGTLPELGLSLGLTAALRLHRFRVGIAGAASLPQRSSTSRTAGVSFDKLDGGAWGAYVFPLGRDVSIGPSAGVEATIVRAEAYGVRSPRNTWTVWPTIATGGRVEARVSRWLSIVARGELLFHVEAPPFSLATVEEPLRLHEPGSPSVRMSVGLEIVLP